jgi:hypothetical protein
VLSGVVILDRREAVRSSIERKLSRAAAPE